MDACREDSFRNGSNDGCAMLCLVARSCPTPCDPMDCSSPGSSVHGDSPGKNTRVGCYFLTSGLMYNAPTLGVRWTWRLTSTKEALAK